VRVTIDESDFYWKKIFWLKPRKLKKICFKISVSKKIQGRRGAQFHTGATPAFSDRP
jgi:hypothetical protein